MNEVCDAVDGDARAIVEGKREVRGADGSLGLLLSLPLARPWSREVAKGCFEYPHERPRGVLGPLLAVEQAGDFSREASGDDVPAASSATTDVDAAGSGLAVRRACC